MIYRSKRPASRNFNPRGCHLCLNGIERVTFKETALLSRFLTARGKIMSRSRSGVCARHQRGISRAIKQARINALLPFAEKTAS